MDKQDSTIIAILSFDDKTGNADLDSQIDETAIELFERKSRFTTLAQIEAALRKGIYG